VVAKLLVALRLLLRSRGALLDEGVDRSLRHLPAAADLHRADATGVHKVPGGAVVDAQHRGHLVQVEEEGLNGSHVLGSGLAGSRVGD
jgi:hypothetical protein